MVLSMLTLKHIQKRFGDTEVLKDISLDVNEGDVIAILGPSGSGKTTLLRCISYLTQADGGEISFDGMTYPAAGISRKDLLSYRKKLGFVFQDYQLFANKTALENVTEGLIIGRGMEKSKASPFAKLALFLPVPVVFLNTPLISGSKTWR